MGKLRLSVHRKNEQRKKYGGLYRLRVPRDIVSIMPVSIPLDILPCRVSLPLSLFSATPVSSLSTLWKRTLEMKLLPQGWIETLGGSDVRRLSQLVFCRLTSNSDQISLFFLTTVHKNATFTNISRHIGHQFLKILSCSHE